MRKLLALTALVMVIVSGTFFAVGEPHMFQGELLYLTIPSFQVNGFATFLMFVSGVGLLIILGLFSFLITLGLAGGPN